MSLLAEARRALADQGEWHFDADPCRPAQLTEARAALTTLVMEAQRLGLRLHVDSDAEHVHVAVTGAAWGEAMPGQAAPADAV